MKLINKVILLCTLSSSILAVAPQKYAIEIIIFSQANKQALSSEHWPFLNGDLSIPATAIGWPQVDVDSNTSNSPADTNSTDAITKSELTSWDSSLWQMNKAASRIDRSRFYNLMEHTAFVASRSDLSNGILVHLNSQDATDNAQASTSSAPSKSDSTTSTANTDHVASANGIVSIKLAHYFNLKFNFVQAIPTADLVNIDSDWNKNQYWGDYSYFHFLSERRMRSKEANYIDFPTLGIIVQITPITDPA